MPSPVWALTLPHNLWEHLTQLSVLHLGVFWGLSAWIILYPKPPRLLFYERTLLKANSLLFPGARHTFIFGTKSAFKRKVQNLPPASPSPLMYVGSGGLILTLLLFPLTAGYLFILSSWCHPQQAVGLGPQGPSSL